MKSRGGFSLIELLIVVVILGIMASIVIPQFCEAGTEAKTTSLRTDIQNVRTLIELYKFHHNEALPGTATNVDFKTAMTSYTLQNGELANPQAPGEGVFGPYLQQIPTNPFIAINANANVVEEGTGSPGGGNTGWYFNTTTGAFNADDDAHSSL